MITYKKLPVGTPRWLLISLLLLGGCIGIGIAVYSLIALYGVSAFLINLLFPSANFQISSHEAIFLLAVGLASGLTATLISFMAVHMNSLRHAAIPLSRIVWAPACVTTLLVIWDSTIQGFRYPYANIWIIGSCASIVLATIFPWLVLRTAAAASLHSK